MKFTKSPLVLEEFFILESKFEFIENGDDNDGNRLFEDYPIDIDYFLKYNSELDKHLLFSKIYINSSKDPLPGYSIFAECITVFSFAKNQKITEKQKKDLIFISGLSIAINNMRSFITNSTSYSPLGKYLLPTVDIRDLLNQKKNQIEKAKTPVKKTIKKVQK